VGNSPAQESELSTTTDTDPELEVSQRKGRPLDASRDVALREAALELLSEFGYDCMTMDQVAARARASKVTIYRRWSGKAELVVDALNCLKGERPVADRGTLRDDLEAIAQSSGSNDRFDGQLTTGLITALARDSELRQVFRERLIDPRLANVKHVFERAVARGEISPERNLDLLTLLLPALILHHLLINGEVPDAQFAQQVIDDVIMPLATAPSGGEAT